MALTLNDIVEAFDALNDNHQLMLLDLLAERTGYIDELSEGLAEAAKSYGRHVAPHDEDQADDIATDTVLFCRVPVEARSKHNAARWNALESAIVRQRFWAAARKVGAA
jgi:hypothetical protein